MIGYLDGRADFALALEPGEDGRIDATYIVRNPDKLARRSAH